MQTSKRSRPCGNCRQRKRRCVVEPGQTICVLCRLYGTDGCTFDGPPPERPAKQQKTNSPNTLFEAAVPARAPEQRNTASERPKASEQSIRTVDVIEDYDTLQGPTLLKNNLGLQQHQFSRYNGLSGPWTPFHLDYCQFDGRDEYTFPSGSSIRRVSANTSFSLKKYSGTQVRSEEIGLLDQIERVVAPHGPRLVNLYFRIIHPSFPVLDKRVFLEKYERTHREFSPACLGGVYLLALDWWNWDPFLSAQERPNMNLLETYVRKGLHDVMSRPKLSALQGGMLLLQHRPFGDDTWALSAQLVATMQELGVHIDCDSWRIPAWEKSLRKRLAWSIYIVDKWMALIHGRPSHIVDELDWAVEPLTEDDFPETPDDEDQEEGSGEIEAGRLSFQMLISLSEIVNEILRAFYSARAMKSTRKVRNLLQIAKPIQIRLREWRRDLPTSLNLESAKARKKSPIGSLHLAYYAVEISLHKAIILGLQGSSCDPAIVSVCREAARERAVTSIEFVKGLTPEQIQSFWHFSSAMNLVYIGIFTALLYLTSQTIEETQSYKKHLEEYRWTLRVMSRAANFVDFAVRRLDMSLLHLDRLSIHDIVRNNHQNAVVENESRSQLAAHPTSTSSATAAAAAAATSVPNFMVDLDGWHPPPPSTDNNLSNMPIPTPTPDDAGFEHQRFMAILDAVEAESLWSDQHISPVDMGNAGRLDFYGRDWNDLDQSEVYPALDPSPS
ncbi:fungal-specific transcription factor domain-containing protein [Aspergillus pseudodeflectus]|uniref:Fungal-specific transcription factor domain-containing protein n=1 Tax=Aspergillus pseudodeflectus TaxID=176178 RepID=A0ABR4K5W4_9EURO